MFKCKTCGVRFPETKGTVFYNRHLTGEQIVMICKLLVEKNGVRAIARIMEIHRDTVSDVIEDLARHARDVTDFLIKNVGLTKPLHGQESAGNCECATCTGKEPW
jgi:hypothetical protein